MDIVLLEYDAVTEFLGKAKESYLVGFEKIDAVVILRQRNSLSLDPIYATSEADSRLWRPSVSSPRSRYVVQGQVKILDHDSGH